MNLVRNISLIVVMLMTTGTTVRAESTKEIAVILFQGATYESYLVGPATTVVHTGYASVLSRAQERIDAGGLTTQQIETITVLRDQAIVGMATLNQKWHTSKVGNPSGQTEEMNINNTWHYNGPALTDYQWMFEWYHRGGDCMWKGDRLTNLSELLGEAEKFWTGAIDSYTEAWQMMHDYVTEYNDFAAVLEMLLDTIDEV